MMRVLLVASAAAAWSSKASSIGERKKMSLQAVLLDSPVYSLSVGGETMSEASATMNIVTYASPVGIRPTRLWAVSLYRRTLSHEKFAASGRGVLQLLAPEQAELVRRLGGESGRDVDKGKICEAMGFPWETWRGYEVLPGCRAYVELVVKGAPSDAGDHCVYVCEAVDAKTSPGPHLSTQKLRDLGIIDENGRAIPQEEDIVLLSEDPKIYLRKQFATRQECDEVIKAAAAQEEWTQSNAPAAQFDMQRLSLLAPLVVAAPLCRFFFQSRAGSETPLDDALIAGVVALGVASLLSVVIKALAQSQAASQRTSLAAQLKNETLRSHIAEKVAKELSTTKYHLEAPVVSHYREGDLFGIHNDASARPEADGGDQGGQRLVTCILYLNDVQRGGATSFDKLDIKVQPSQGDALFFYPADPKTLRPDDRTTHESLAAIDDKWIVQLWQRQRTVPPPLGLEEQKKIQEEH